MPESTCKTCGQPIHKKAGPDGVERWYHTTREGSAGGHHIISEGAPPEAAPAETPPPPEQKPIPPKREHALHRRL